MSYDVYLQIDTGDGYETILDIGNYTSNVGGMWRHALGVPLRDLHGKPCADVAPLLQSAVAAMERNPDVYRAMNPSNGWGNYDGALQYLRDIAAACAKRSKCRLYVSS